MTRTMTDGNRTMTTETLSAPRPRMIGPRAWVAAAMLACAANAAAEAPPSAPDAAAVRTAMEYYDTWLAFRQQYLRVPGVQVAVRIGDREVLAKSYGLADVERNVALTDAHLFRVASHSKTFTATAVMQLVERGVLRLDDTAGHWLPWLEEAGSPLAEASVRELLSHASGVIRDGHESDFWHLGKPFPDRDALREEVLAETADVLPANQRHKYSNVGYSLLGLVMEAASGESYNALLQREVVDRLGLRNTGPEIAPERLGEFATGYTGLGYAPHRVPIDHIDTASMSPATGFYSNASDLANYFSTHFFGDTRLLSDASKRRMQQTLWDNGEGKGKYGLGMAISTIGDRKLVGHSGGFPGFITMTLVDPQARVVVSALTNAIDGPAGQLAQGAFRLLNLAGKPSAGNGSAGSAPSPERLRRFTGRYATLFSVVDIALLGGRLYMITPTSPDPAAAATPLAYVDERTLRVDGGSGGSYGEPVIFTFDPSGAVTSMRLGGKYVPLRDFRLPERVRLVQ